MSRYEKTLRRPGLTSAVSTLSHPTILTYNAAPGFERDAQSELFLLAAQVMVDEKTFYEKDADRRERFRQLVWHCSVAHEEWTYKFLAWLRQEANVRSAAIAGACEFVHGRWFINDELRQRGLELRKLDATLGRAVCDAVCQRGDEPAELFAYWEANYGKPFPAALRRGARDAAERLYNEYVAGKYDGVSRAWRLGDVAMLSHPRPRADWQSGLFSHVIGKRLGLREETSSGLPMIEARIALESVPVENRRVWLEHDVDRAAQAIKDAGMPWEAVSGWLQGPMDKLAWEACIPSMGLFALLRNLRNFDEAGVSDEVAAKVSARLSEPEHVRLARLFPSRFLSAYRAVSSLRWSWALEQGLSASLALVPALTGRTLILIDTSDSMWNSVSKESELVWADQAQVFGIALAKRILDSATGAAVDIVSFSGRWHSGNEVTRVFELRRGTSLLAALEQWKQTMNIHGSTETKEAVDLHFRGHDRVVCLTDEQADRHDAESVFASVPDTIPCYTWNIAGYRPGHAPSGRKNRHVFAGLSDSCFQVLTALESGRHGKWPWELSSSENRCDPEREYHSNPHRGCILR